MILCFVQYCSILEKRKKCPFTTADDGTIINRHLPVKGGGCKGKNGIPNEKMKCIIHTCAVKEKKGASAIKPLEGAGSSAFEKTLGKKITMAGKDRPLVKITWLPKILTWALVIRVFLWFCEMYNMCRRQSGWGLRSRGCTKIGKWSAISLQRSALPSWRCGLSRQRFGVRRTCIWE